MTAFPSCIEMAGQPSSLTHLPQPIHLSLLTVMVFLLFAKAGLRHGRLYVRFQSRNLFRKRLHPYGFLQIGAARPLLIPRQFLRPHRSAREFCFRGRHKRQRFAHLFQEIHKTTNSPGRANRSRHGLPLFDLPQT